VLIWFATLVALANGLTQVGFTAWLGTRVAAFLSGLSPTVVIVVLVSVLFLTHYLFASITAHVMQCSRCFLRPVLLFRDECPGPHTPARVFTWHHGDYYTIRRGSIPIYYASGYVPRREFWLLGLMFGVLFVVLLLVLGLPYLSAIHGE